MKRKPSQKSATIEVAAPQKGVAPLTAALVRWSLFNLMLVAVLGVMLRAAPLLSHFPLQYKNLLHGHSHFAFGGWVMPLLLALVLKVFPAIAEAVAYRHWRNISVLLLLSAYGMLLSFPFQGYGSVSIVFSTLSLAGSIYMAVVVWKAMKKKPLTIAHRFLKWGLFYLVLSSFGPLATGPLIAMGFQGTPLYYNAIYFYLHFTYNGWFTFAVLALWYGSIAASTRNSNNVFVLLNWACLPAYALSVLWNKPPEVMYWIGGVAGVLQLMATYYLLRDARLLIKGNGIIRALLVLALFSFVLKNVLQALSALPSIAAQAALQRNLVIAYLHLVLLGFVSLFLIAQVVHLFRSKVTRVMLLGLGVFLICFTATELILAGSGTGLMLPYFVQWLAGLGVGMLAGLAVIAVTFKPGGRIENNFPVH